jgi:peptidyl-prolyl cis-trans isomerase C
VTLISRTLPTLTATLPGLATAMALLLASTAAAPAQDTTPAAPAETQTTDTTGETPDESAGEAAAPVMTDLTAETVIATVGGYDLTLGELISVRQALPQQYQALPPEVLAEGLTTQLINQTILAVRAQQQGLEDRADIQARIRNERNSALADAYMREEMQARLTPEMIEQAYQERYVEPQTGEGAEPVEEVRAAHILVDSREKAAEIKAEYEAGTPFAELAQKYGTDGTKDRGGDLGYFTKADMVPEFADAAFAMEIGTVSDPVESPFGWHLIQLNDRRDRPVPPLEEVRDTLLEDLAQETQQAILAEARESLTVTRPEGTLPVTAVMADDILTPAE